MVCQVSIIIPTLNEEKYLPLLLESITRQNFKDYEIIVADADSKDGTIEIAKKYNCKIVKGGTVAQGRNAGAKISQGNLLLFLDADVIFPNPDFLAKLLNKFQERELEIASFPVLPQGKIIDKIIYCFYNLWAWFCQGFLAHATEVILVKKKIHQKIAGFDKQIKIAEDHAYVRKAAKFGKYGFLKLKPVFTSSRRFEQDGRLKTYSKYLLAGLYVLFFGPVRTDIFNYKFNHYSRNKK